MSEQIPGVALNFTQPIIDTVTESVTGSSADLAVIISGPDLGQLRELANTALQIVKSVSGSTDVSIEQEADPIDRKLIGVAAEYPADSTLRARTDELNASMAERRKAAWAIIFGCSDPVP